MGTGGLGVEEGEGEGTVEGWSLLEAAAVLDTVNGYFPETLGVEAEELASSISRHRRHQLAYSGAQQHPEPITKERAWDEHVERAGQRS